MSYDYFPLKEMSDEFLTRYKWHAQETRDSKLLELIKEEQNRRIKRGE